MIRLAFWRGISGRGRAEPNPEPAVGPCFKAPPHTQNVHPRSGYHYIHVICEAPSFSDEVAVYRAAAARIPWMSFLGRRTTDEPVSTVCWNDPRNFFVIWQNSLVGVVPHVRMARAAGVYAETVGNPPDATLHQRIYHELFKATSRSFDVVFEGTPTGVEFLRPHCRGVSLAPIGYDAAVQGVPDFGAPKTHDIGIYGTFVGRRLWAWPALKAHFGPRILDLSGSYGIARKRALDSCRINLLVAHSSMPAMSHLRLWQAVASSAALVKEPDDSWPAQRGRHYIEIPRMGPTSVADTIREIEGILGRPDLASIAESAHRELSVFTVENVMEGYIVPASMGARI